MQGRSDGESYFSGLMILKTFNAWMLESETTTRGGFAYPRFSFSPGDKKTVHKEIYIP